MLIHQSPTSDGPEVGFSPLPGEAPLAAEPKTAASPKRALLTSELPQASSRPAAMMPGPAPLPDPSGPQATDQRIGAVVQRMLPQDGQDDSAYTAYWLMQHVAGMGQKTQSELMRIAQDTSNQARRQEAYHTLDQVRGQNQSTVVNAAGMLSTSVLAMVGGLAGFLGNMPSVGQFATQLTSIAQPFIGVVDRYSSTLGGTYHSNLASLQLKDDAIYAQSGSTAAEAARSAKDSMQERMRFAMEFLSGHLQRKTDSLINMTR